MEKYAVITNIESGGYVTAMEEQKNSYGRKPYHYFAPGRIYASPRLGDRIVVYYTASGNHLDGGGMIYVAIKAQPTIRSWARAAVMQLAKAVKWHG